MSPEEWNMAKKCKIKLYVTCERIDLCEKRTMFFQKGIHLY